MKDIREITWKYRETRVKEKKEKYEGKKDMKMNGIKYFVW